MQLDRNVKIVRSDSGGEYYGKYDKSGQHHSQFGNYIFTMACNWDESSIKNTI